MAQFPRTESPPSFDDYRDYRPWLRRDFRKRCAYCERREAWLGGEEFFVVDHFRPSSRFPELRTHYPNLYYSCFKCNQHKAAAWPSSQQLSEGFRFSDPCEEDMYVTHLRETETGLLEAFTNCGRYTSSHIRLDRPDLVKWRQAKRAAQWDIAALEKASRELENLALDAESSKREQILLAVASLRRRLEVDRDRFLL